MAHGTGKVAHALPSVVENRIQLADTLYTDHRRRLTFRHNIVPNAVQGACRCVRIKCTTHSKSIIATRARRNTQMPTRSMVIEMLVPSTISIMGGSSLSSIRCWLADT